MARKRTGLRNRYRTRHKSAYSRDQKSRKAEIYDRPHLDHPNHPGGVQYNSCCKKGDKSDR